LSQYQVLEYEWIGKGERVALSDSQLALLDHLCGTLPGNVIEWQRNRFRFCGYCGVLQLGSLTLEILPKIHGTELTPGKSRELLIRMLSAVQKLELHNTGCAELNLQKHVLLDIFILSFAEKLQKLLRQGMSHTYVAREETLRLIKGKIAIPDQLRCNHSRHDRIACCFDEFQADNLHNRIIKAVLVRLSRFAHSHKVRLVLEQLCGIFSDITDYFPVEDDWTRLAFDRTNRDWEEILNQCRWFLKGMSPDVISGEARSLSLLFSMNALFEEYIAIELKKSIGDRYEVLAQKPQKKLLSNDDGNQLFTMKPDLFIRCRKTNNPVAILDTKWKLLNGEDRKMGISQADLYQMYTYAGSYGVDRVVLIYPLQGGLSHLDSSWRFADQKRSIAVCQIDLHILLKSREVFRSVMSDQIHRLLSLSIPIK